MGVVIIITVLVFTVWASTGKLWYIYILNAVLLFAAASAICTSWIQELTRAVAFLKIQGREGIINALNMSWLNVILWIIGIVIAVYVFSHETQYLLFFVTCIALSTIVAFIDKKFQFAIENLRNQMEITEKYMK